MTVRQSHIPFCTEDDRVSKHDIDHSPRMLGFTKLDVLKYHDGYVEVLLDDKTLALMGEGPFKILLAAARHGATISWTETEDSMPTLVSRFFGMLFNDLGMITPPVFRRNYRLRLIVVGGMTNSGRASFDAIHRKHLALLSDVTP